jgi:hypothetical protein
MVDGNAEPLKRETGKMVEKVCIRGPKVRRTIRRRTDGDHCCNKYHRDAKSRTGRATSRARNNLRFCATAPTHKY